MAHVMAERFDPSGAQPGPVRDTLRRFQTVAKFLDRTLPDGDAKDRALHKLVSAKDAAVRATHGVDA